MCIRDRSGIGKAIVEELLELGVNVANFDLSDNDLRHPNLLFVKVDVTSRSEVEEGVAKIVERFGNIDAVVNNAGITRDNLLLRMSEDDWDDILNIHLKAVYRLSKRVLKGMTKARFGRIINVSSVVAHFANPGQANYSAAKAGIEAFSRSLAKEMGSRQITVNSLSLIHI